MKKKSHKDFMEYAKALLFALVAILTPIHQIMTAMFVLIIFDLITGIWASMKRKEKFSSAKLRSSISKVFVYYIAIICAFILEQYLSVTVVPVINLTAGMIGLVEMKSITENLNSISGNDIFKLLIEKLGSYNLASTVNKPEQKD